MLSARRPAWPYGRMAFICLLGLLSLGLWVAAPPTLVVRGPLLLNYLPLYLALFAPYFAALFIIMRAPEGPTGGQATLAAITVLFAVLFRLPLLSQPPSLSDDVYRYIWDGYLQTKGLNPYQHRVDSAELDFLATPNRALVNNPVMASPYFPVAQVYFAAGYSLWPESPAVFQWGAAAADLAAGLTIMALLRRLGRSPALALLYMWNPLVIVEFAHGAHVDALMVLLIVAALWLDGYRQPAGLWSKRLSLASPIVLGLATLVKPLPVLLLAVLGPRWGKRGLAIYFATVGLGFLPYLGAGFGLGDVEDGTGMFGALLIYMRYWNFNAGLFHWLSVLLTGQPSEGALPADLPGVLMARALTAAGLLAGLLWALWRSRNTEAGHLWWPVPFAFYLLLTPTVHPWYLTVLIALLPFAHPWLWVFLAWSATVGLSYLTYLDANLHREVGFVRVWEYAPLYGLLLAAYIQRRTRDLYRAYVSPNLPSR